MKWIHNYQLFLFDFDGLLVNTEELHYRAYIEMCAARGFALPWDFVRYSAAAHHSAEGLRDQIYAEFPALQAQAPDWSVLHKEKNRAFCALVEKGPVPLMPGVERLLKALQAADIPRCVVTHSTQTLIDTIRRCHPLFDTIPYWITRGDYSQPKPHPEAYQTAIERYGKPGDAIIGFEDSPRGLSSLQQTSAKPVLICPNDAPYLPRLIAEGVIHYPSFDAITDVDHP